MQSQSNTGNDKIETTGTPFVGFKYIVIKGEPYKIKPILVKGMDSAEIVSYQAIAGSLHCNKSSQFQFQLHGEHRIQFEHKRNYLL